MSYRYRKVQPGLPDEDGTFEADDVLEHVRETWGEPDKIELVDEHDGRDTWTEGDDDSLEYQLEFVEVHLTWEDAEVRIMLGDDD